MAENPNQESSRPPIAFVLLERAVEPDLRAVVDALRARHPDVPVHVPGESAQSNSTLLECDGELVTVMSLPASVPRDDATVARASAIWPEAAATINSHRAHLIVSVLGKDLDRLHASRTVTAVVGGIVGTIPGCVAVIWDGLVAHPAARWLDMSRRAFAPYPNFPFMLWLSIHSFNFDSAIVAVTFGLKSFIGREIEFEGEGMNPPTVIKKVTGLSVYLIERGSVIPNGDTFGRDERERLRIHHATSERFPGLPVLLASAPAR